MYETNNAYSVFQSWSGTTIGVSSEQLPPFEKLKSSFDKLQEISDDQLVNLLNGTPLLISVHDISRHELDFLYILEINSINAFQQVQTLQEYFQQDYSKKTRTYLDNTITEIAEGDKTLSFVFYKNFLVASFSAFLVEDALRTLENGENQSFIEKYQETSTITKLAQDQGNIYVNLAGTISITENYLNEQAFTFDGFSYLDLNLYDNLIELNGFTIPSGNEHSFLTPHQNITPGTFDMGAVIPLQSALAFHYSFEDPALWGKQQLDYLGQNDPGAVASARILKNDADFDISQVFEFVDDEIGLVFFERIADSNKMLIMEVENSDEALAFFDNAAIRFSRSNSEFPQSPRQPQRRRDI